MVARVGALDRQKGAGPDMQGQRRPADVALGQRLEQSRSEMQTCGRRRHRSLGAGKDRLIVSAVTRVAAAWALDIGRQRHRAVAGERVVKRFPLKLEPQ